jgi:hypothetical protein
MVPFMISFHGEQAPDSNFELLPPQILIAAGTMITVLLATIGRMNTWLKSHKSVEGDAKTWNVS